MLKKIISGGQTGADRAALDFAIKHKIPHGGWVPKGRLAEDGQLPKKYKLTEMPTTDYQKRTEQNVIGSDGTVNCADCSFPPLITTSIHHSYIMDICCIL